MPLQRKIFGSKIDSWYQSEVAAMEINPSWKVRERVAQLEGIFKAPIEEGLGSICYRLDNVVKVTLTNEKCFGKTCESCTTSH